MNTVSHLNKNLLLLLKNSQNVNPLFQYCLQYTKREKVVLLLTTCSEDLLPLIKNECLTKEELKRLVIIQLDNIDAFIQKLLDLHVWAWLPALIIVDLRTIIDKLSDELELISTVQNVLQDGNNTEAAIRTVPFFQQIALLIASILGYKESILKRLSKRANSSKHTLPDMDTNVYTVLILKEHSFHLNRTQLDLLINLYYYVDNAFDDVDEVVQMIMLKDF